jgi:hypothetical protein
MKDFKFKFSQKFYRVMLWWVVFWSKTYRFFAQPKWKYKKTPLDNNLTPWQAWERIKVLEWREDTWKVLNNVLHRPEYVQLIINCKTFFGYQPDGSMDCDDFAVWCANVIEDEKYEPCILMVSWQQDDGTQLGHAVCLIRDKENNEFHHVGNWGIRGPFKTLGDAIRQIKMGHRLIGWAAFSKDLKLLNWGTKL